MITLVGKRTDADARATKIGERLIELDRHVVGKRTDADARATKIGERLIELDRHVAAHPASKKLRRLRRNARFAFSYYTRRFDRCCELIARANPWKRRGRK